jgi:hypothetical protein
LEGSAEPEFTGGNGVDVDTDAVGNGGSTTTPRRNYDTMHSLKVTVNHELPLQEAAKAHKLLETGSMTGKIILLI